MGLNFVVKRGTNQFRGSVRGYFDNESDGVVERARRARRPPGVTHETSDHNKQISDYGGELGGPIFKRQGVVLRLVFDPGRAPGAARRRAGRSHAAEEPEREGQLAGDEERQHQLPVSSTASRSRTAAARASRGILFDAPTATYHQDNAYDRHAVPRPVEDRRRPHLRLEAVRVGDCTPTTTPGSSSIRSAGSDQQAGRNFVTAQSYGSVNQSLNVRPQHVVERRRAVVPERLRAARTI